MKELLKKIDQALISVDNFSNKNKSIAEDWPMQSIKKILILFKESLVNNQNINQRLLRSMKDIYVVAFRNFEGTEIQKCIENIDNDLRKFLPYYEKLEPLGMDFGKENPI